jgi:hypothetical protein
MTRATPAVPWALLLLPCLLSMGTRAAAEPVLELQLDGQAVTLADGLPERIDGTLEISARDLTKQLGVVIRPLRPRPVARTAKRLPKRLPETEFLLRKGELGLRRKAEPGSDPDDNPRFSLAAVAKGLGFALKRQEHLVRLQRRSRAAPPAKRLRVGERAPLFLVEDLDGKASPFGAPTGRWQLIVLFASWSPSRERLAGLVPYGQVRQDQGCDLAFVALDLEGAKHVRTYAPSGRGFQTRIDRDGMLLRQGQLARLGRWLLIDARGWLRAAGQDFDPVDWAWIDAHLREDPLPTLPKPEAAGIEDLDMHGRAQYARAVDDDAAAARAVLEKAWESGNRSAALAWHLARLHLDAGQRPEAIRRLEAARDVHLDDLQLRRQLWALSFPERYYGETIDLAWERKTKREENKRLGKLPKLPRR